MIGWMEHSLCRCWPGCHECVHEAGHVVAAIDYGIPFVDAVVFPVPQPLQVDPSQKMGGRVLLDEARGWTHISAATLFSFALAGRCAEKVLLGHKVPGGCAEDVANWRRWVGLAAGGLPRSRFEGVLGVSVDAAELSVEAWSRSRIDAIKAVSERLATAEPLTESQALALLGRSPLSPIAAPLP